MSLLRITRYSRLARFWFLNLSFPNFTSHNSFTHLRVKKAMRKQLHGIKPVGLGASFRNLNR